MKIIQGVGTCFKSTFYYFLNSKQTESECAATVRRYKEPEPVKYFVYGIWLPEPAKSKSSGPWLERHVVQSLNHRIIVMLYERVQKRRLG